MPRPRIFVTRNLTAYILPFPQPSHKLCLSVNKTTIYTLPKNSARNLSKNSKNLLTKYDNLW